MQVELIFFRGCERVDQAREFLRELKISFIEICQDDLKLGDPLLGFSSPTITYDGQVVVGSKTSGGKGCTFDCSTDWGRLRRLACAAPAR